MLFGVVTAVGLGMGVLDFDGNRRREWAVLGVNLGRFIVTSGAFATRSSQITLMMLLLGADVGAVDQRAAERDRQGER